jgi:hypothetical protein
VVLALLAVVVGIVGNVLLDPSNVRVFGSYLAIVVAAVAIMFLRLDILKALLFVLRVVLERANRILGGVRSRVVEHIQEINSKAVIYFTRGDDPAILNRAALYVLQNEETNRMQVVHVYERVADIPAHLAEQLKSIDHLYPQLRIDFVAVKGTFGPELIERLSKRLQVPKNQMFIGTPGDRFPHRIEDLGGVRVIL